jgi:hypothetical protein
MSKYQVFIDNILIGHSDLECGDPPMGIASGHFFPLPVYTEFQSQFIPLRELSQSHLALAVTTSDGKIVPAKCIAIFDYSEELDEIQVAVIGIEYLLYEELFPEHYAAYENQFC